MIMKRTRAYRLAAIASSLLLMSCQQRGPADEEDTFDPPAANPTVSQSIIRPEVAPIRVEPEAPLEPLRVSIGFPDGSGLDEAAQAALEDVFASEQLQEGGMIVLRGHSDSAGSDAANLRASQRRAEAVRNWLMDKGVAQERIVIIALGEQNPVQPNALPDGTPNEEGRAANRRVEVTVEPEPPSTLPKPAQRAEEASADSIGD